MLKSNPCCERERLIAECVGAMVSELRLVDVEQLIALVTLQMFNNIADLVASSCERHFLPGFITLGQGCDVAAAWDRPPVITIDLIMHLGWGKAYFSVRMGAAHADVHLNYFSPDHVVPDVGATTMRLRHTIAHNQICGVKHAT
jgi:hypothetical protein